MRKLSSPTLLAGLSDLGKDRQGKKAEACDHSGYRIGSRRSSSRHQAQHTVAEVTYSNSISVSEHVVMMILSLVRNYIPSYKWVIDGSWKSRTACRAHTISKR